MVPHLFGFQPSDVLACRHHHISFFDSICMLFSLDYQGLQHQVSMLHYFCYQQHFWVIIFYVLGNLQGKQRDHQQLEFKLQNFKTLILGMYHTPFFDQLFFYSYFESILPSYFIKFLHFISRYFYQFISRHSTCLYLSILSVHFSNYFTRLFSNFYPFKSHFYLFVLRHCTFIFPFYSFLKTEKSRCFRRNFGREVTLKYLIWFRRDSFKSYYFFLSNLFLSPILFYLSFFYYYYLFIFIFIFIFSLLFIYLFSFFIYLLLFCPNFILLSTWQSVIGPSLFPVIFASETH